MMYNLTSGDFSQIDYIRKNWTVIDLYKWIGIQSYIIREAEKK